MVIDDRFLLVCRGHRHYLVGALQGLGVKNGGGSVTLLMFAVSFVWRLH